TSDLRGGWIVSASQRVSRWFHRLAVFLVAVAFLTILPIKPVESAEPGCTWTACGGSCEPSEETRAKSSWEVAHDSFDGSASSGEKCSTGEKALCCRPPDKTEGKVTLPPGFGIPPARPQ